MKDEILPISCEWNITNVCNMHCCFCSMDSCSYADDFALLSLNKIDTIVETIKKAQCIYVSLSGGEPMLHPLFWDIVKKLRKAQIEVSLTTNGTFLNETSVKRIKLLGVRWVQISLHGHDKTIHDAIMGEGSFDKIKKAITLLRKYHIGFSIASVELENNKSSIRILEKECDRLGIPFYSRKMLRVGRGKNYSLKDDNRGVTVGECKGFFSIQPNGQIQVCGECKKSLGNVFEDEILEVWQKNKKYFLYCSKEKKCLAELLEQGGVID